MRFGNRGERTDPVEAITALEISRKEKIDNIKRASSIAAETMGGYDRAQADRDILTASAQKYRDMAPHVARVDPTVAAALVDPRDALGTLHDERYRLGSDQRILLGHMALLPQTPEVKSLAEVTGNVLAGLQAKTTQAMEVFGQLTPRS